MRKNVGVIGLGIIGRRVVANLRKKGFPVFVWNRTPRPVQNFVGSPAELAQTCEIIQIFVSDDDALLRTIQQLASKLTARHIVIAHPTVSPDSMRAAAELVEKRRARFVEAPFTGSKLAAEKGELIYYVAGDESTIRSIAPVLAASSKAIVEIGEIGDATVIKVATNLLTATSVQVAAEALALVEGAGVSLDKFLAALRVNSSHSATLEMKVPRMIAGDFEVHFSTKHMLKDMQIASRLARSGNLDLPVSAASLNGLMEQMKDGRAEDDYSCVARKYFPAAGSVAAGETLELFKTEGAPSPVSPTVEPLQPVPDSKPTESALDEKAAEKKSDETSAKSEEPTGPGKKFEAVKSEKNDAIEGELETAAAPAKEDADQEPADEAGERPKSDIARAEVSVARDETVAPADRRSRLRRWLRRSPGE